jgi:hypothetical protein
LQYNRVVIAIEQDIGILLPPIALHHIT